MEMYEFAFVWIIDCVLIIHRYEVLLIISGSAHIAFALLVFEFRFNVSLDVIF